MITLCTSAAPVIFTSPNMRHKPLSHHILLWTERIFPNSYVKALTPQWSYMSIPHFWKVLITPLQFYERATLVPAFTS